MKALFLSDAHLLRRDQGGYACLHQFLDAVSTGRRTETKNAALAGVDRLFLVGDIFDFWFARGGRIYPEFREIVDALRGLQAAGVRVSLCEGNHDFRLADFFTGALGMDVYPDMACVEMDGRRMLVAHGDTVDPSDRTYLFLRRMLRSRAFVRLENLTPLWLLWRAAALSSRLSKGVSSRTEDEVGEKMAAFARRQFAQGYDAVILGHCHRPVLREEVIQGRRRTFATLGDWTRHCSWLLYEHGEFTLSFWMPGPQTLPSHKRIDRPGGIC